MERERQKASCFILFVVVMRKCSVDLPRGSMGWSPVYDRGVCFFGSSFIMNNVVLDIACADYDVRYSDSIVIGLL